MTFPRFLKDPLLLGSGRRLLELWKPLLLWHGIVGLLFFLLLTPLGSWILGFELFRGGAPVIANIDLLSWALSWRGFLHLCLLLGIGLLGSVVRFSGIFLLLSHLEHQTPFSLPLILRRVLRLLPRLFQLCITVSLTGILWFMILGSGIFLIYRSLLGEFDINFYLSQQPREVYQAAGWLFAWFLLCLLPTLWLLGRILIVLPATLAGDYRMLPAVRKAWALPKRRSLRLLRLLATLILSVYLLRLFASSTHLLLARWALQTTARIFTSVRPLLAVSGFLILIGLLFTFLVGFATFNLASILVIRFYYEETPLHRNAPPGADLSTLGRELRHLLLRGLRPRRVLPLFVGLTAISLGISLYALSRLPEMKEMYISAHRAGPPPAPENTLAALDAAIAAGADFTEIDLQLTSDGRVVVVHDADLMRVANSPLVVTRSPYAAMQDLIQVPNDGSPPSRRRVATLEEFLDEAAGRIRLMIELKYYGFDPDLAVAVMEILDRHPTRDQHVLMSLDLPAVRQLRELAPDLSVGYLLSIGVGDPHQVPADFLAVSRQAVTPALLRRAAREGREVHVWTVNRKQHMIELISMGVDGLITDDPALAVQVRDELRTMTPVERLLLRWIVLALPEAAAEDTD